MPSSTPDTELRRVLDEAVRLGAIVDYRIVTTPSGNRFGPMERRVVHITTADGQLYEANPSEAMSMAEAAMAAKEA